MNVGARSETAGPAAGDAGGGPTASPPDAAGRLLARLSVLPALLVMAWLLAGFLLLLTGRFTPLLALAGSVPVAVVLVVLGLRWIPAPSPQVWPVRTAEKAHTPWWAVAGVVAVAVAFGADQAAYHSQFIIVMRDPASYFQFAEWISHHGSLPIPQDRAAFGSSPSSLLGLQQLRRLPGRERCRPAVHGRAADGTGRRYVGGRCARGPARRPRAGRRGPARLRRPDRPAGRPALAPLETLALAVSMPEQFTSRSSYSELLAQILFLGGLCLVGGLPRPGPSRR